MDFAMTAPRRLLALPVVAIPLLVGCGGGSTETAGSEPVFVSFASLPTNGDVKVGGRYGNRPIGSPGGVLQVTGSGTDGDGIVTLGYQSGALVAISVEAGAVTLAFDPSDTATEVGNFSFFEDMATNSFLLIRNPGGEFQYSSFGYGLVDGVQESILFGAFGAYTDPASIVTAAGASYSGESVGIYFDSAGNAFLTAATIAASTTDFSNITVDATGSRRSPLAGGAAVDDSNLDFSGTVSITGIGFSGTVSGTGGSGQVTGWFFGPSAAELGGSAELEILGGDYIATFGATKD